MACLVRSAQPIGDGHLKFEPRLWKGVPALSVFQYEVPRSTDFFPIEKVNHKRG